MFQKPESYTAAVKEAQYLVNQITQQRMDLDFTELRLGELALHVQSKYGEHLQVEFSDEIGLELATLTEYAVRLVDARSKKTWPK